MTSAADGPGDGPGDDDAARRVAAALAVNDALGRVLRWAGRGDVRRDLLGPAGAELTLTDSWLLTAVHDRQPVRASDLATWQGVDRSTITTQVRRLEDRGLVARTPEPGDRRAFALTLTPRGAQVHRRITLAGATVLDRALAGWDPAAREALAAALGRLAEGLEHRDGP
ncbi:MarR family winged helix-turn-helix transcriptional regulator [uncultured Cellulomonas sp.]|uniref:MarR family winged helix-turn-helix transcriptional regulator n=1 Tax=uncultured Cellulomonas sp. TaxID=189682 RepID=UPI00261FE234|nr:MarR family transcriptional regulator [uncultured Cellulomonas sp.]